MDDDWGYPYFRKKPPYTLWCHQRPASLSFWQVSEMALSSSCRFQNGKAKGRVQHQSCSLRMQFIYGPSVELWKLTGLIHWILIFPTCSNDKSHDHPNSCLHQPKSVVPSPRGSVLGGEFVSGSENIRKQREHTFFCGSGDGDGKKYEKSGLQRTGSKISDVNESSCGQCLSNCVVRSWFYREITQPTRKLDWVCQWIGKLNSQCGSVKPKRNGPWSQGYPNSSQAKKPMQQSMFLSESIRIAHIWHI